MLTLSEIKQHLELDQTDASRNNQLAQMNLAAVDYMQQVTGRPIPWLDADGVEVDIPDALKSVALLIVGDLFENREGAVVGVARVDNPMVDRLLHPYRVSYGV